MVLKKIAAIGMAAALMLTGTSAYAAGTNQKPQTHHVKQPANSKVQRQALKAQHKQKLQNKLEQLKAAAAQLGIDTAGKSVKELSQAIREKKQAAKQLKTQHHQHQKQAKIPQRAIKKAQQPAAASNR
jgi:hypothetical protein